MEQALDLRGLACPLPILRTKKAIDQLAAGDVLVVTATDPGAVADFKAWTDRTGHILLSSEAHGGEFHFRIQKRP